MDSLIARLREPQFVQKVHEMIFHVLAQSGRLDSLLYRFDIASGLPYPLNKTLSENR